MDGLRRYYYTKVKLPQCRLKPILFFFGVLSVSVFVLYWAFIDFYASIDSLLISSDNDWQDSYLSMTSKNAVMIPEYNRYIAPTVTLCGGIGNMMWRYASMYGLGRQLNRTPFFESSANCMKDAQKEALATFPEYGKRMKFFAYNYLNTRKVDFGFHCCKTEKIDRLKDEKKKFLILGGYYFQDYHYFENVSSEIRFLFSWSTAMRQKVDTFKKFLFGLDASHKLCVHTRMGDFVKFNIHSKINFTEMALDYAYRTLQTQFRNISVVLLGQDKTFLWSIKYNKTLIPRMYVPISMSRTEDMAFASIHCDSLLITAQASTFGWWIGYLMDSNWDRSRGSIFFNSNFKDDAPSDTYGFDNFPSHWIPLRLVPSKIVVEDRLRPISE